MSHEYQNLILIYKELTNKCKDKQKKKQYNKLLAKIEAYDVTSPETNKMLKMYQKKLQIDFMVDFWLAKFAKDSADDSDFEDEDYGHKKEYVQKIRNWHHKQNEMISDLFMGTMIIDEDQTYAVNLVGKLAAETKSSKKKKK